MIYYTIRYDEGPAPGARRADEMRVIGWSKNQFNNLNFRMSPETNKWTKNNYRCRVKCRPCSWTNIYVCDLLKPRLLEWWQNPYTKDLISLMSSELVSLETLMLEAKRDTEARRTGGKVTPVRALKEWGSSAVNPQTSGTKYSIPFTCVHVTHVRALINIVYTHPNTRCCRC